MRLTKNEKGIALVMVLILSVIALALVSAMLFMIMKGTQISGYQKFYRTSEEAGLGGAAISASFIQARGVSVSGDLFADLSALLGDPANTSTTNAGAAGCTDQKIKLPTAQWTVCNPNDLTWDPSTAPSMIFDLPGPVQNYRVYTKIVDTVVGNSEVSALVTGGGLLGGQGVVASNSAMISPPHIPYLYSMEIQAQASTNPNEKSRLSVLYAY